MGRWPTPTTPGELSELREPSRGPNCKKPEMWVRIEVRSGDCGCVMARVKSSPGGTGKAVAMWIRKSEQGGEAVGALAGVPREGAAAQPAERTVGSPPQLHSHPLEAEGAPGQQERSQWDCPEKAAPQQGLVSWASKQTWGGKEG